MKNAGAISGDIISYTALPTDDRRDLEKEIRQLLDILRKKYEDSRFFGRLVQGDHIECALDNPAYLLRIGLLLKTYIKSLDIPEGNALNKRTRLFREHGLRLAVAVAPMETIDARTGIIDGEAIQLTGRTIQNQDTSEKRNIIIKNTLFFKAADQRTEELFQPVVALLDILLTKSSGKQCQVVYHKLMGLDEAEIARKLNRSRSTINEHSTAAGWHAIEKSVVYFEKYLK